MPSFVVDLPGGGGKRLASTYETYNRETGISTFKAPGLGGAKAEKVYVYHDPLHSLPTKQEEEIGLPEGPATDPA